jgi:hypothetical protein
VAGYSYGSMIGAAAVAEIPQSIGVCILSPPLDYGWALYLLNSGGVCDQAANIGAKPKLLMVGGSDEFCSVASFEGFVATLPEPKRSIVIPRLSHFALARHIPEHLTQWIVESFHVNDLQSFARTGSGGFPAPAIQRQASPERRPE